MADIKLRTGEILYQFPSDVAHALICLGLAEKYIAPPPEPKRGSANFLMDRGLVSGEPCIKFRCEACSQGGVVLNPYPSGRSVQEGRRMVHVPAAQCAEEAARAFAFWHCGQKQVLPESLIQEFRKRFE
jgi:hypothetical protein